MSVDVDVGSKELGLINKGTNDANISSHLSEFEVGEIEETMIPEFVELIDSYKIPATFAVRGQLAEVREPVLATLLSSPIKHDIGAHGYYHRRYGNLSSEEAENEIRMISQGMRRLGLVPKSFIFPRNSVAHLNLLEKHGYECYRDHSSLFTDSMRINRRGMLIDVHPSLLIDRHAKFTFLKCITDIAVRRRLPLHLWFHMRDFGQEPSEIKENMQRVLVPLFNYAELKREEGILAFETMLSAARKSRHISSTVYRARVC